MAIQNHLVKGFYSATPIKSADAPRKWNPDEVKAEIRKFIEVPQADIPLHLRQTWLS
jgi:hypothetical protein